MSSPQYPYSPHDHANTKASLKAWWKQWTFTQRAKKEHEEKHGARWPSPGRPNLTRTAHLGSRVFGVPLRESLKYASVHISTANANGQLYIWGYVPVVVAKCGLYLKENATEVEGTFRVNGSNKRMRDLQATFETPPRYGKDIDWTQEHYTTHDVASVFRRYLTQMPEPVILHELYHEFREALSKKPYNQEEVISTYKRLIGRLPRANQYLLLYVLDLLSVFARKSDKNLMTATNLAVIFRPGLISHPSHEMSPEQHALSQEVLEFLIAHQDWFMLDIAAPTSNAAAAVAAAGRGEEEGAAVSPWSEEDELEGEGWKLVEREPGKVRRRASSVTSGAASLSQPPPDARSVEVTGELGSISEKTTASSSPTATGGASVSRSKTLPPRASQSRASAGGGGGVLRKKPAAARVLSNSAGEELKRKSSG
ncbi:Rho GTPase activation protein [Exidia glandulosa HHB12029]|uniref:Rho GTPase activation protein n=1 Tax=Exidia glandulosa HHB12029 TaxID=1314781 RepID=A0A165Q055_EXIGL|nr:Rho GTPase activation protein [Exidia glandulosa HHB12029]